MATVSALWGRLISSMSYREIDTMLKENEDKLAKMRSSVLYIER
ncbi:hypothetical protein CPter291_0315 [Collimonas pratensis]|uniref:Uncharacterized protein n=1 Tax=Collimonas pratensis TaxID=279113 RepID=A0A127PY71_9BURK|nr:hypothetical protein CPter91_0317 [Collimonas pratensis]AMP12607.1 hypothetical protein CPter291_0315 [Collimonas pratensis]